MDVPVPNTIPGGETSELKALFALSQRLLHAMASHGVPNGSSQGITGQTPLHEIVLCAVQEGFLGHQFIVEPGQHDHSRLTSLRSHPIERFKAFTIRKREID